MGDATFMMEQGPLCTGDTRIRKITNKAEYHVDFHYFDYCDGEEFWESKAVFKTRKEAIAYEDGGWNV